MWTLTPTQRSWQRIQVRLQATLNGCEAAPENTLALVLFLLKSPYSALTGLKLKPQFVNLITQLLDLVLGIQGFFNICDDHAYLCFPFSLEQLVLYQLAIDFVHNLFAMFRTVLYHLDHALFELG